MPVYQVLKGLLAGAAALTLAVTGVTTASAAQPVLVNRGLYAAVGDSFAAGVGNPTLPGAGASLRSADDAFGGHGLCDGAVSYIFPPTFDPGTLMPMPSSLHPTPDGQMAYAEAIADAGFLTTALAG